MNVYIAGGTSGIGLALAKLYLSKNCVVAICGRDLTKIDFVQPRLVKQEINVLNYEALLAGVQSFAENHRLDLFINCTGDYTEDIVNKVSYEEGVNMLQTNIMGTINCLEVSRLIMKENKSGQIALIASVSGILEYEKASIYSKSKRAVIKIAQAYQRMLKPYGITITTIAPGYVDTQKLRDINRNNLTKKPFLIPENTAAELIYNAIAQKQKLYIFPFKMKLLMRALSYLPSWMLSIIMYKKAQWMKVD